MDKYSSEFEIRQLAEKYVCDQLKIMDGSAEAGIKRVGAERYEHTVKEIAKSLNKIRSAQ